MIIRVRGNKAVIYKENIIKFFSKGFLVFILFLISSPSLAMVWKSENTWDDVWEKRYQHSVTNNWTAEFFMNEKKPRYYKFSHDCADAVYAMRLVFAYESTLPFVIHNPSKPGRTISIGISRWD